MIREISWEGMKCKMMQQLTVAQLRRIAKKSGLKLQPLKTKEALVNAIVNHRRREWAGGKYGL